MYVEFFALISNKVVPTLSANFLATVESTSRPRTKSLLFPTRILGGNGVPVCVCASSIHPAKSSSDWRFVTSYTQIIPCAPLQVEIISFLDFAFPVGDHIWKLRCFPTSTVIFL
eukprot:Phypoly_transcript_16497.p1 GENE.Phypoly_transcript_16497~~Phypoly_transcript_16497.p1  ORF type:complete len:114 (-),score=12.44 Phypoly_transcript_16497:380-721(-)